MDCATAPKTSLPSPCVPPFSLRVGVGVRVDVDVGVRMGLRLGLDVGMRATPCMRGLGRGRRCGVRSHTFGFGHW